MLQIQNDKLVYFEKQINNINRKLTYNFTLHGEPLNTSNIMDVAKITYDCGLKQYSVGNLYIGCLEFSVKSDIVVVYKDEINISVTIDIYNEATSKWEQLTTSLGTYYVDTTETKGLKTTIKAYDKAFKLNRLYVPTSEAYTTTNALMQDIVTQEQLTLRNWNRRSITIDNAQIVGKTYLEMLCLIGACHGGSFFFDFNGELVFTETIETGIDYSVSEYNTPTKDDGWYNITKLRIVYGDEEKDDNGNVTDNGYYEVGEGLDTQTLVISNPLLKGQQVQALLILNKIKALNGYKRFDTTVLLGDYRLEPLDKITFIEKDGTKYNVPILYMQYKLTYRGLTLKVQSPVEKESKSEFTFKGTLTQKVENTYQEIITAKEAFVKDLNATNINVTNLRAEVAEINTLVNGNLTSDNIHSMVITADKFTVQDGFIQNAMVDSLNADKINAGTLNTANVIIGARDEDGGELVISDNTIQISDGTNVRVQIGKDASGDYNIVIMDENGSVMLDANGITEDAIKDAIIRDDMVDESANINATKINISSLFKVINEDGTHTIKGSQIFLDTEQQKLSTAFTTMSGNVNTLSTSLTIEQGRIDTLISNTTITDDGKTVQLKDAFTSLSQDVDSINLLVNEHTSDINGVQTKQAELEIEIDSISTRVDAQVNGLTVGARNYILESDVETVIESYTTTDNRFYTWNLSSETPYIGTANKGNADVFTLQVWYSGNANNPFTRIKIGDSATHQILFSNCTVTQVDTDTYKAIGRFAVAKDAMLGNDYTLTICCDGGLGCSATIKKLQLEQGSIGSSYTVATEDMVGDYNDALDETIQSIVNSNQDIQNIVQDILSDDFISDSERADLVLIHKEITSQYNNVIKEVDDYGEENYFSSFKTTLISSYTAFSEALSEVLNNNADSGKVALQELLSSYYDAYHNLLYVISQYIKSEYQMLQTEIIQTNSSITQVITGFDDEVNERKKFMEFSEDGLQLFTKINGQLGAFMMVLSENRLSFYENGSEVAYMSNNKLFIKNAEITTSLQIGDVVGRKSSNNGFVFHEVK